MIAFTAQSSWSSPGRYRDLVRALPDEPARIIEAVGGLFLHSERYDLYGLGEGEGPPRSRATLPLEERLQRICALSPAPLSQARPPAERQAGTCRDYALATCGLLREKGHAARVRCGFAAYLLPGRFEDHWICEYREGRTEDGPWARADAQLDGEHRRLLDIRFDPADMPDGAFLTSLEAWRLIVEGGADAAAFGHGEATGLWFVLVNLVRDGMALHDCMASSWDGWRDAADGSGPDPRDLTALCRAAAGDAEAAEAGSARSPAWPAPFWL